MIELNFPFYRSGGRCLMPTSPKPQNSQTFESALAELEKIVAGMEAGQMPLEKSLAAYRRGAELLKFCQAALQDAQQQVKILEGDFLQDFNSDNEHRLASNHGRDSFRFPGVVSRTSATHRGGAAKGPAGTGDCSATAARGDALCRARRRKAGTATACVCRRR